jgi:hypothetical protein
MSEELNSPAPIVDDKILLRHTPSGEHFVKPPPDGPKITSLNFRLRVDEEYLSLARFAFHSADDVIMFTKGDRSKGSQIIWCSAERLRAEGFRIEPKPLPNYPGHAGLFGSEKWPLERNEHNNT